MCIFDHTINLIPHCPILLKTSPRCLCGYISWIYSSFKYNVGWMVANFLDMRRHSVFCGLNVTSHFSDNWCTLFKFKFKVFAPSYLSSIMTYIVVSSANNLIEHPIYKTISLINVRKRRGPRIDPCGTPAFIVSKADSLPFIITFCFRNER